MPPLRRRTLRPRKWAGAAYRRGPDPCLARRCCSALRERASSAIVFAAVLLVIRPIRADRTPLLVRRGRAQGGL